MLCAKVRRSVKKCVFTLRHLNIIIFSAKSFVDFYMCIINRASSITGFIWVCHTNRDI